MMTSKKNLLIFVVLFLNLVFISCSTKAKFNLEFLPFDSDFSSGSAYTAEKKQSKDSEILKKTSGTFTEYQFSPLQRQTLSKYFEQRGNMALLIRVFVKSAKPLNSANLQQEGEELLLGKPYLGGFGFLYEKDINSLEPLAESIKNRPIVSVDFREFIGQTVDILFSISAEENLPIGFFIDTSAKISILNAQINSASAGFDFSKKIPLFAFAPNGGTVEKNIKKVDLTALSLCYSSTTSKETLLPNLSLSFFEVSSASLTIGGEKLTLTPNETGTFLIPLASLKNPYSTVELSQNSKNISCLLVKESDKALLKKSQVYVDSPLVPIKIDPGLIIKWDKKNWRTRDYELFEWDRFDGVLYFDTANYSVQDDFFRRLAFFVEKKGYKGNLMTDEELKDLHGFNAHDYKAYDLARFFDLAQKENFKLNKKENLLKEILLENGVIKLASDGSVQEGRGAIISLSQESPLYLRTVFLAHEGWHGIFFVDEDFRNTSASIFYALMASEPKAMEFLFKYFQVTPSLNYDINDDYLMKNEFMAYMLQRPVSQCEKYYMNIANWNSVQTHLKEEADYILQTRASGFVGSAQMFDEYVGKRWNLSSGRVWLISR